MHSDWSKLITWLTTANHKALFQSRVLAWLYAEMFYEIGKQILRFVLQSQTKIDCLRYKRRSRFTVATKVKRNNDKSA